MNSPVLAPTRPQWEADGGEKKGERGERKREEKQSNVCLSFSGEVVKGTEFYARLTCD